MPAEKGFELATRGITALKITTVDAPKSGRRGFVIDPHDGRCQGTHNISVTQYQNAPNGKWSRTLYTVGPVAILSRIGTEEILAGLQKALELGAELDAREDVES